MAKQYLRGSFGKDIVCLLPIGYILGLINPGFKILWAIKSLRILNLSCYFDHEMISYLIRTPILTTILNSIFEIEVDEVKIESQRERAKTVLMRVRLVKLYLGLVCLTYFVGLNWFLFTQLSEQSFFKSNERHSSI